MTKKNLGILKNIFKQKKDLDISFDKKKSFFVIMKKKVKIVCLELQNNVFLLRIKRNWWPMRTHEK